MRVVKKPEERKAEMVAAAAKLFAEQGFAPFQQRFAARDVLHGQQVHLSDGSSGLAAGVLADGTLQLRTADGLRSVISGDVSVRPVHMDLPPAAA